MGLGEAETEFYLKALKKNPLAVIRAVDEGATQVFHDKGCAEVRNDRAAYSSCVNSQGDWWGTRTRLAEETAHRLGHQ